jgi:hypothetical protein
MNHNNVISLPVHTSTALSAGDVVALNTTTGGVVKGTAGNQGGACFGVVLHDVDSAQSGTPAAIQLFQGGGIFNINVLTGAGVAAIGIPHNLGAGGLAAVKGGFASGTHVFLPLEATSKGGIIEALYMGF